jgi:hypothetical protein
MFFCLGMQFCSILFYYQIPSEKQLSAKYAEDRKKKKETAQHNCSIKNSINLMQCIENAM